MADTTALKNRIRAAIKANNNQEITGPVLQQALLDMVDEYDSVKEETLKENREMVNSVKEETLKENREMVNSVLKNYAPVEIGDVNNAADEEDLTSVSVEGTDVLKFKDKVYNPLVYSGLGRKILRKNIVDGVNILTQSMVNQANTIYVIQYDFTLGEDIIIPANCVLDFNGGGSISGEHIITGQNTKIENGNENIFGNLLTFAGSFLTLDILANWFAADNDAQMFQKAFDFAKKVYEGTKGYYEEANPKVACLTKVYHIDDTINIKYGISFDGSGAQFNPTGNLKDKWMFKYNVASNDSWEVKYTACDGIHFCNFSYSNPNNILSHFLLTGSPIKIHDIRAFRPARFIYYTYNYIDKKYIKNCVITGKNTNFPLDANDFSNTCSIRMYLGDSCEISNISDSSNGIYIGASGQVRIDGAINTPMYIKGCNSVSIRNIHNENGIIYVEHSTISIEDSYFWAIQDGNIRFITNNYKFGEVNLKNCVFSNLKKLPDFHSYNPIVGLGKIITENTFGLLYPISGGNHNDGHYIGLKYNTNTYINCNRFIANSGIILDDNVQLYKDSYTFNIKEGQDAHIRMFLLADKKRGLYLAANNTAVDKAISLGSSITMHSSTSLMRLSNAILRIEIGDTNSYTHYFDFPIVNQNREGLYVSKEDDAFYLDGMPFKTIDYTTTYIKCDYYKRENNRVYAELSDNTLPNKSMFENGDTIKIKPNNLFYTLYNDNWLSQKMFYHQSGDSTNTWVKVLRKNIKPEQYSRYPTHLTIVAINIFGSIDYVELYLNDGSIQLGARCNNSIISKMAIYADSIENTITYYCYINASHHVVNCLLDGVGTDDYYYDRTISSNITLPDGAKEYCILLKGTSSERNTYAATAPGMSYFDTTLGKPIWWNGTNWVDATGATV